MCVCARACVRHNLLFTLPSSEDDSSLPKKQMEVLSDVLQSAFFNSVKDVSLLYIHVHCTCTHGTVHVHVYVANGRYQAYIAY